MPFSRDNPIEQEIILDTDDVGAAYLRDNERFLTEGVRFELMLVDTEGNAVFDILCRTFDTAGEARATCYNFFLELTRDGDFSSYRLFELRKVTFYIHQCGLGVQLPRGCVVPVTKSVETLETIRRA